MQRLERKYSLWALKTFGTKVFALMILMSIFLLSCINNPVDLDYYKSASKIQGGEMPQVPTLHYNASQLEFFWNEANDPDTGKPVATYYLYGFFGSLPNDAYHIRHRVAQIENGETSITLKKPIKRKGNHIFALTSFDGERESFFSNYIFINVQ